MLTLQYYCSIYLVPKINQMKIRLLFISSLLLSLCHAQEFQNIEIGGDEVKRRGLCEPSIAVSKKDPQQIVAGAILDQVFYSSDGGKTWINDTLKSSHGVWGDPVIASDWDGNFYFLHLSDPTGRNWFSEEILDRIVCQRSEDGGKTWNDGGFMGFYHPKDQDKHWVVTDKKTGNLYVTWTQFDAYGRADSTMRSNILFSKSEDKGDTWSEAVDISQHSGGCLDDDNTTEGAVPAVSGEGDVYVAWSNHGKIYFDKSHDDGKSWMEEDIVIADHIGGWEIEVPGLMRANGMPVTVCDISGKENHGAIYVSWVDDREGNYDVWFSKSKDKGSTWSTPKRINDDDSEKDQFFHWMACDPVSGYLYTVFYDRREHSGKKTDVYLAVSRDGGESWKNFKISESSFKPTDKVFFGDYNDIDAYNGIIRPIWTRYEKNRMGVWTAIINEKDLKK